MLLQTIKKEPLPGERFFLNPGVSSESCYLETLVESTGNDISLLFWS